MLLYTRLDRPKKDIVLDIVDRLTDRGVDLTILGGGELFWQISDEYGAKALTINHIPCHSIQRFLTGYDVIVSSGRGVMEACASGVPTICAGLEYGGILRPENVTKFLPGNLTGRRNGKPSECIVDEVAEAAAIDGRLFREMAEEHFDAADFVRGVRRLIEEAI